MSWYKQGTVNVVQNSDTVIGVGTVFIANGRTGDGFRGPDGNWYEITNIASDTAISISPNYQGVSSSAGTYALAPLQGYVKDSADQLRLVVNKFGSTLAVLGNTATVDGIRSSLNLEDTDGLPEGAVNKYFNEAKITSALLTGLNTSLSTAVTPSDAIVSAVGKLQGQIGALSNSDLGLQGQISTLVNSDLGKLPLAGGKMTGPINSATPQVIASAATTDIGAVTSDEITISGTATIISLGAIAAGARRSVRFSGVMVLTHNATSLILQTGTNITTAVNDTAEFLSLGDGNWFCQRYTLANGKTLAFAFDRSNIVGPVNQKNGLPGGAVIEQGVVGSNGYSKFSDGTLICYGFIPSYSPYIGTPIGSCYYTYGGPLAFPAVFAGVGPRVQVGFSTPNGNVAWGSVNSDTSGTSFYFLLSSPAILSSAGTLSWTAIGRWY